MVFEKLFGPKWKHRNPSVRKHALENLNPIKPESQEIFSEVIKTETDSTIRRFIVRRLADMDLLQNLIETQDRLGDDAVKRLRQIIAGKTTPALNMEIRLAKLSELEDNELLEYLVKEAEETEFRLSVLENVKRQSLLGDLAVSDSSQEIRLKALSKITQLSTLERVYKNTRRKDKKVSTQAQLRLDKIKADKERPEKLLAQARQRCAELQALIEHGNKTHNWMLMQNQAEQLKSNWECIKQEWQDADGEFTAEISENFQVFWDQFVTNSKEQEIQAAKARELEEKTQPYKAQQRRVFESLKEKLRQFDQPCEITPALQRQTEDFAKEITDTWKQAEKAMRAQNEASQQPNVTTEFTADYEQLLQKLQNYIKDMDIYVVLEQEFRRFNDRVNQLKQKKCLRESDLSGLEARWQALPKPAFLNIGSTMDDVVVSAIADLQQQLSNQKLQVSKDIELFKELVQQLERLLKDGLSKKAANLVGRARKVQSAIPVENIDLLKKDQLLNRYHSAITKLNELQAWRSWANAPVKQSIYERMCALEQEVLQHQKDPEFSISEVADQVRAARAEWKSLSKAEPSDSNELWELFDQVCNRVYEPCQVYFENLAQDRKANLIKREVVCQDLEAYWQSLSHKPLDLVDWKGLDEIIQAARQEWRILGYVDRKDKTIIERRFRKVLNSIGEFSKAHKKQNAEDKRHLISKAEQLAEELAQGNLPIKEAIAATKDLQKRWKEIGMALKDGDLWRSFRSHCDAIFSQREHEQALKEQKWQLVVADKATICDDLEKLIQTGEGNLATLRQHFVELERRWKETGELPKKMPQNAELDKRYRHLDSLIQQQIQQLLQQEKQKQADMEAALLQLCRQAEASVFDCLDGRLELTQCIELASGYVKKWESLAVSESALLEPLKQRITFATDILNQADNSDLALISADLQEAEAARIRAKNELCLRVEILAGVESPPELQQERMEYQVAQLADKMRQGRSSNSMKKIRELLLQWHSSGLVRPLEGYPLEERFFRAYKVLVN